MQSNRSTTVKAIGGSGTPTIPNRILLGLGARSWLRHYVTNRKFAGSIPEGVIRIFHWRNPSGSTKALGLTQPLTEMSTRNVCWGKRRPVRRADNLTIFMCRLSWNLGASTSWNSQGLSRPVIGLLYLYTSRHIDLPKAYTNRRTTYILPSCWFASFTLRRFVTDKNNLVWKLMWM